MTIMDNCCICGRPITTGVQYIVSHRYIRNGDKSWYATDHKHYAFCDDCDRGLTAHIERVKCGCYPIGYYASRDAISIFATEKGERDD